MKHIKLFLLILSLFAVLACGSDGSYTADGDSTWACYSPKSAIYNAELNSNSEGASRSTAAVLTVTFFDNNSTVYEVQVSEGDIITLPDIRAKHCFHGSKNQILLGWNDKNDNYTTGGFYTVTKDVTFTSVWEDGVEIYNAAELDNISKNLSGKYKLMRNIDLKDYMTDQGWTPIGNENERFTGRLYGNGYRIDNLKIDNKTGSAAGLFGEIGGSAEIYDLSIILADSGISLTTPGTDKAVGALAGYIKYDGDSNIIIKNVRTSGGKITADSCSTTNKNLYAGGLVGGAIASGSSSLGGSAKITLDNLSNRVPVSVESVAVCYANLGGIIGRTELTDATASLTSSVNYGEINLKDTSTSTGTYFAISAGGLIGRGDNITVKASANRDNVTVSTVNFIAYAGGIVGLMGKGGTIDNNSNIGNISARSTYDDAHSGGIVGKMNGGDIDNDNNIGNVEAKSTNNVAYAGGIVGKVDLLANLVASATIDNSSNTGAVRTESVTAYSGGIAGGLEVIIGTGTVEAGINNNSNIGKVEAETSTGDAYSGGIVGFVPPAAWGTTLTATIDNCSNVGSDNISAISNSTSTSILVSSGGIVGSMEGGGSIINSRNTDNVTATSKSSSPSYAGGIAGKMSGGDIENDNNSGDVSAESASNTAYSGGIVGQVNLEDTSAAINNNSNIGKVIATGDNASSGGVAGSIEVIGSLNNAEAQIENNSNTGKVEADASTGDAYSGGIAGRVTLTSVSPAAATATIDNCSNVGSDNISALSNSISANHLAYSGGIVGYMEGGNSLIKNSRNTDNVTAVNAYSSVFYSFAGGIAGYVSGSGASHMENNDNTGDVTATSKSLAYAGGIAGYVYGSGNLPPYYIEDNDNTGDVTATSNSSAFAGGIAGDMTRRILIKNSHNADNVIAARDAITSRSGGIAGRVSDGGMIESSSNAGRVELFTSGSAYAGGIAGYITGTSSWIKNCGNTNNVAAESISTTTSDTVRSGGIVGHIENCNISNSYNAGAVSATATSNASYSGGIAGHMNNAAKVENSYNRGEVTAISSGGTSYSGGIAGGMGPNTLTITITTITNSYNADNISGGVTGSGGILGYMDTQYGTVTKCAAVNELVTGTGTTLNRIVGQHVNGTLIAAENFANATMSIAGSTVTDSPENGTGKPLSDLKEEYTYKNDLSWSFGNDDANPWRMPLNGSDYPYPILYWQ